MLFTALEDTGKKQTQKQKSLFELLFPEVS